jgi:hypothetical protein
MVKWRRIALRNKWEKAGEIQSLPGYKHQCLIFIMGASLSCQAHYHWGEASLWGLCSECYQRMSEVDYQRNSVGK